MLWLLAGIGLLFLAMGLVKWASATDPRTLLFALKTLAAVVGVVVGLLLLLSGRIGWLVGLLPLLLPFMLRGSSLGRVGLGGGGNPFSGFGRSASAAGQASQVKTRFFDMRLDHETGELDGEVLDGPHAGRQLSELSLAELLAMLPVVRARDGKSGRLLEAYLDRRSPDWRDVSDGAGTDAGGQSGGGGDTAGAMTAEEALRVLGLNAGASKAEVRAAYHRLIRHLHPDQGGSSFLAAQVNRARDVLLGGDQRRR